MTNSIQTSPTRSTARGLSVVLRSPWLWGAGLTFAFYAALPYVPVYQESIEHYFTAHWIEYATTGLFFVGISTLVMKGMCIPAERRALAGDFLKGLQLDPQADPVTIAGAVEKQLQLVAQRSADTHLVRRIRQISAYVIGCRSAAGLEGHLSYLAELGSARLSDGYALIRTITWAVPILGFLGTVIGITMAIANITPDQLESSLPEVTAGLAVAFDTTALSLALSMILVFTTFVIEKSEQNTLDDVEDFGVKHLLSLFPANDSGNGPMILAETQAAEQLLTRTEDMINRQTDLWQNSLESLRDRWTSTLARQQQMLDQALQDGFSSTLVDHAQQLAAARVEFVATYQSASTIIAHQVAESQTALTEHHERGAFLIAETWKAFHGDLIAARDGQVQQMAEMTRSTAAEVGGWTERLHIATLAMTDQLTELRHQGESLLKITEGESELIRLEQRLVQNLDTVRVVDTLEETLLNLNAVVILLTARAKAKAA